MWLGTRWKWAKLVSRAWTICGNSFLLFSLCWMLFILGLQLFPVLVTSAMDFFLNVISVCVLKIKQNGLHTFTILSPPVCLMNFCPSLRFSACVWGTRQWSRPGEDHRQSQPSQQTHPAQSGSSGLTTIHKIISVPTSGHIQYCTCWMYETFCSVWVTWCIKTFLRFRSCWQRTWMSLEVWWTEQEGWLWLLSPENMVSHYLINVFNSVRNLV